MRITGFFSLLAIYLCLAFPIHAQEFRPGASFWTPPANTRECRASFQGLGQYTLSQRLVRQPWPDDDAVNFAGHFSMRLADALGGRNAQQFKSFLLDAAGRGAYTQPVHSAGWSPIYVQSNLIRLTAMSIILLESRNMLAPNERAVLIAWGDAMIPGQRGDRNNQSSDSRMASGVAMMA